MTRPKTEYTMAGDISIAYQVVGDGDRDLLVAMGFAQNIDLQWDSPMMADFFSQLGSFSRLILFDKRGTGLSDRSVGIPSLEERTDDIRAVLDAVGSTRAVLFGVSEGAPMSLLFAATYPERVDGLILFGGMARATWAPDYPWAPPAEDLNEAATTFFAPAVFTGEDLEIWMPSLAGDTAAMEALGRYRRSAVSPSGLGVLFSMFLTIDVRHVLPAIHVPTLVIHRHGDRVVNRGAGEWMASQIEGARYVDLPGADHFPWAEGAQETIEEVRNFMTGERRAAPVTRVLSTVLFTDIVDSTLRNAAAGDQRWTEMLRKHDDVIAREVERAGGRLIKSTGDGALATFDGPARAVRCAQAIVAAMRGIDLCVRAGLHSGEIELRDDDIAGLAVVIASRISALAGADEVLVSSTVKDLVAGSGLAFEDQGEHELKGVPDTWRILRALG